MAAQVAKPSLPSVQLPIMEQFLSLQGEGRNTGQVAYFIRLAGCDVGCVWCDVKASWDAEKHPLRSVEELVQDALRSGSPNIVITGGEPSLYDLTELSKQLRAEGLQVWLETAGVYPLRGEFDWICLSPKSSKLPYRSAYPLPMNSKSSFTIPPTCLGP